MTVYTITSASKTMKVVTELAALAAAAAAAAFHLANRRQCSRQTMIVTIYPKTMLQMVPMKSIAIATSGIPLWYNRRNRRRHSSELPLNRHFCRMCDGVGRTNRI